MKIRTIAVFFISILLSSFSWAQSSPVEMLQANSDAVIQALQASKASIRRNPQAVYGIVDRIFVRPHVDLGLMSRKALGPNAWNSASPSQRARFGRQFADLLIHTYAGALAQYTNEKVQYFPMRGDYQGKKAVSVDSVVIRANGPKIPISYKLVWRGSEWKVYDMTVEGISLVSSFRSQFGQELSQGGIEHLIQRLQQHNAKFK